MRDARIDPRPGDMLRKVTDPILLVITERKVLDRCGECVTYCVNDGKDRDTEISKWRKWAKNAEVVTSGAEAA